MQRKPLVMLVLLGCGGGGSIDPTPTTVIAKTSGDEQQAIVGQVLPSPIQVLVTEDNTPVAGATVSWTTGLPGDAFTPASGPTDADGLAATTWTLGPNQGIHHATATVNGSTSASVNFTATALHDAPAVIAKFQGDNQSATVNSVLQLVQAQVTDQFGNSVGGVAVDWSASGGTLTSSTVATNPFGIASAQVTLGSVAGPITITAAVVGLDGSPLTFNATAEPIPTEAEVRLGNIFFTSDRNSSTNPAVDTVAVGGTVTWTWGITGFTEHSVRSVGTPSFTSSATKFGNGQSYSFTFTTAGSYSYDCAVHGAQMTGRVIVR
jgi:adhesin/invasin